MSDSPGPEPKDSPKAAPLKPLLIPLAGLLILSCYLAANRIYQVDEAQNAYMAWLIGAREIHRHFVSAPAFLLPFAWLSRWADSPGTIFNQLRFGFCALFWINLLLMVRAAGFRIRSRQGLLALLFIALLPPLWTYGLEIRHENVIVLGLLLLWNLGRRPGRLRRWSFHLMGAVAVFMQASTFKSLAYWAPVSLAMLLLPLAEREGTRARSALQWLLGAAAALGLLVLVHLMMGTGASFLADQTAFLGTAGSVERFAPVSVLSRLFFQAPLLMGLLLLPAGLRLMGLAKGEVDWKGPTPEFLLFVWTLVPLAVNPNPFPYNVLAILAAGAVAAAAFLRELLPALPRTRELGAVLLGVALATQAVPFLSQAATLVQADNDRQSLLMDRATQLTDPRTDAVYDGAGLVPTRLSTGYFWFVNITNVAKYRSGAIPTFRSLAQQDAPAVVLPSYRFSYLDPEDFQLVQSSYLPLAQDFLVLGSASKEADRTWNCLHAGRYAVFLPEGAPRDAWIRVDGQPAHPGVQVFAKGSHHIEAAPGAAPTIYWVGPKLNMPPSLAGGQFQQGIFPVPNAF